MNNEELVELYHNTDNEFEKQDILIELCKKNKGFLILQFKSPLCFEIITLSFNSNVKISSLFLLESPNLKTYLPCSKI